MWCLLRHNNHVIPGFHLLPSSDWQSRCDLSYLLYRLFILAIYFLNSLSYFIPCPVHLLHFPHALTLYLTFMSSSPTFSRLLSSWLFFPTAFPHTPLVAAASLLKVQSWLMLLPWWYALIKTSKALCWVYCHIEWMHQNSADRNDQALRYLKIDFIRRLCD